MEMTDSILTSIKKLLGIDESYKHFDSDLVMHINSVLSILTQIGVGPAEGFSISGDKETWADFIKDDPKKFSLVKSYVHLKVKLLFDPPLSSAAIDAINRQISEFEWRLFVAADPVDTSGEEEVQMENNELRHYGIKGMKWGVRRFQNEDGSYTAAGKRRAKQQKAESMSDEELAARVKRLNMEKTYKKLSKESEPKSTLEKSKDVVDSASSLANRLKEADRKAAASKPKPRMDLSSMSDKEMRDRINRELLERQYNDLFAQPDSVSRGRQYVSQIIDSVGTGLAIGGSALSIALAVQKLKKG